jgi:hypothetical protein
LHFGAVGAKLRGLHPLAMCEFITALMFSPGITGMTMLHNGQLWAERDVETFWQQ